MKKPIIHTILFISGIFLFFGTGFFGVLGIQDTHTSGGYWQVFELSSVHADDDDEDEDEDEGRWIKKERDRDDDDDHEERQTIQEEVAPVIEATTVAAPAIEQKASPIVVRSIPKTQDVTIMSSLIEPYKPMNGLTYVIYHLPDDSYIAQDPDGRFIDKKYTSIESAKKAIDAEGIYEPLIAYSAPSGETFIIMQNISTKMFAYRDDDGAIMQTAYMSKAEVIQNLISENPYNPNNQKNASLENIISSDDIAYAQAIAIAEGSILELISDGTVHAISIERPIVPADHQVSMKSVVEKKVITVASNTSAAPTRTTQAATAPAKTTTTPAKQTTVAAKPAAPVVAATPKPITPPPAAPAKKPVVNTTTRAS